MWRVAEQARGGGGECEVAGALQALLGGQLQGRLQELPQLPGSEGQVLGQLAVAPGGSSSSSRGQGGAGQKQGKRVVAALM